MQTFIKSGNTKLWVYIGALALMAGLWKSGEAINHKLSILPIKTAPKSKKATEIIDQKSFYAVWVKRLASSSPEIIEDDQAIENLFKKEEREKQLTVFIPEKPIEPDYPQIFKSRAKITGVSNDGIFINRQFYKIGQAIENLSMQGENGKIIKPTLQSIKKNKAVFMVNKEPVVFLFGLQ